MMGGDDAFKEHLAHGGTSPLPHDRTELPQREELSSHRWQAGSCQVKGGVVKGGRQKMNPPSGLCSKKCTVLLLFERFPIDFLSN